MLLTNRQMHLDCAFVMKFDEFFDLSVDFFKVRVFAIHLVDNDKARQIKLITITPGKFSADFNARNSIY